MTTTNYALAQFRQALKEITTVIPFNPEWHNGTGYFDPLVKVNVDLPYGGRFKTETENGRKIIGIVTPFGNVVVFERYADPANEIEQRICTNAPSALNGVVLSPLTNDGMVLSIVGGFDFQPNIGSIFKAYDDLLLKTADRMAEERKPLVSGVEREFDTVRFNVAKDANDPILERRGRLPNGLPGMEIELPEPADFIEKKYNEISHFNWEVLSGQKDVMFTLEDGSSFCAGAILETFQLTACNVWNDRCRIPDRHNQGRPTEVAGYGLYLGKDNTLYPVPLFAGTVFSVNKITDGEISTESVGPVVKLVNVGDSVQIVSAYNDDVDMTDKRPSGDHYFVAYVVFDKSKLPVRPNF